MDARRPLSQKHEDGISTMGMGNLQDNPGAADSTDAGAGRAAAAVSDRQGMDPVRASVCAGCGSRCRTQNSKAA